MGTVVRAIDVGFGNTKYVTASQGGKVDCGHFTSMSYFGAAENNNDGIGGRRRTVSVPIGELFYVVGPDVELAADRFRPMHQHDGFTQTAEYRALMAGALHFMKVDRLDLLVVGLPVAHFMDKRAALQKAVTGTFDVGGKRKVAVKRALVVAQPQGALIDYATQAGSDTFSKGRSLVIDAGYRTFDWLVTRGMRVVGGMSSSVPRGMHDILVGVARKISVDIKAEYDELDEIDQALRAGRPLRIFQKDYDLKRFGELIDAVADGAVMAMAQRMGATFNVENIVLVGGAAHLYRKAIKRQFPRHKIREVDEPLFANVRGFQLLGEQYAQEHPEMFADAAIEGGARDLACGAAQA